MIAKKFLSKKFFLELVFKNKTTKHFFGYTLRSPIKLSGFTPAVETGLTSILTIVIVGMMGSFGLKSLLGWSPDTRVASSTTTNYSTRVGQLKAPFLGNYGVFKKSTFSWFFKCNAKYEESVSLLLKVV